MTLLVTYFFMKWNDIREKIKKPVDSMNVRTEKSVAINSNPSESPERHRTVSNRAISLIIGAILVLIIIIIIWFMQSRKVADMGPATDAGLTREQAQDAQGFLIQAQPKPMTESDVKEVDEFFKSVELKNSATLADPAN